MGSSQNTEKNSIMEHLSAESHQALGYCLNSALYRVLSISTTLYVVYRDRLGLK